MDMKVRPHLNRERKTMRLKVVKDTTTDGKRGRNEAERRIQKSTRSSTEKKKRGLGCKVNLGKGGGKKGNGNPVGRLQGGGDRRP